MRILILTVDAGFGHRSAATALEAAFAAEFAADCEITVANPFDSDKTPAWLRNTQSDYDRIARDMPEFYRLGFDLSDMSVTRRVVENALSVLLFRSVREAVRASLPDAILVTFPLYLPALWTVFIAERKTIPVVCALTDLARMHQLWFNEVSDVTVVPTEAVRDLAIGAGLSAERVEVIGIPVHPRIAAESRSKAEIRSELGWDPSRTTILAVGSKRVGKLFEVLNVLNHSGLPIQIAVAAGGDDHLHRRLGSTDWHIPVHVYNFVKNLPTMMRGADIMISKAGGLVVTESLAAGLPLLLIDVLPGQEVGNAEYVVNNGAGEVAKDGTVCLESLCHWLADGGKLLDQRAENARRLGHPRAAFDIAARTRELAQAGPRQRDSVSSRSWLRELFNRFNEPWDD